MFLFLFLMLCGREFRLSAKKLIAGTCTNVTLYQYVPELTLLYFFIIYFNYCEHKVSILQFFTTLEQYLIAKFTLHRSVYKYAVVEFTEENQVEVVPAKWLSTDQKQCFWPINKSSDKVNMAIKQLVTPTADFKPFPVKVLYQTGTCI